jgi:amino acid transporter
VKIEIAIDVIALITIANLRGLRESGNIFAVPTYAFVFLALLMVGIGLFHIATGQAQPIQTPNADVLTGGELSIFLLLKAFAGGSVALTGVEAIANGVPAFQPPESKNAANTMTAMAVLLGILFIGITIVAHAYQILPTVGDIPTTVSLVAATSFGKDTVLFVLFQASTALILFLAANTSFNAFPGSARSSRWTASCPASSPTAATGSPTPGASSSWRRSRRSSSGSSTAT